MLRGNISRDVLGCFYWLVCLTESVCKTENETLDLCCKYPIKSGLRYQFPIRFPDWNSTHIFV